jgi:hypothetical protein
MNATKTLSPHAARGYAWQAFGLCVSPGSSRGVGLFSENDHVKMVKRLPGQPVAEKAP